MTIHAIYENGVFRPIEPVNLPENSEVEITVHNAKASTPKTTLQKLADIAYQYPDNPSAPTDLSVNLDHYLYGMPKRQ
jgi:predicted DNA-binding antitoxin AbrB/MazE fold protein